MALTQIAIIGSGLSGTLTAINLLRQQHTPVRIDLYEQEPAQLNRGAAYRENNVHQPLNVPISRMSLFSQEPNHFYHWLHENETRLKACIYGAEMEDYVPRKIFGDYLTDIFEKTVAACSGDRELEVIAAKVLSITPSNEGYTLASTSKKTTYHQVILASGNVPPQKAIFLPPNSRHLDLPIIHSWEGLPKIDSSKQVLIVGSGLSMVDTIIELDKQGYHGPIRVLSRHGLIPLPEIPEPHNHLTLGPKESTYELLKAFRELAKEAEAQDSGWRTIFHNIRPEIPTLWQTLSDDEKQCFMRHLQPFWEIHRHRVPAFSHQLVQNLIQSGNLQLLKGRITNIVNGNDEKTIVTYRPRHTLASLSFETDLIINCTGPVTDLTRSGDPLLEQLLQSGYATTGTLQMGLNTNVNGELINSNGNTHRGLFAIGSLRKGNLWETTALREIRQQAEALPMAMLPVGIGV